MTMTDEKKPLLRSEKQLKSAQLIKAYQKEWWNRTQERLRDGEPFAICMADDAEDIFTAMDIPVIVIPWWSAQISAKRMSEYYGSVLSEHGYDMDQYTSLGLGVTLDHKPEIAPWGGLPKPLVIMGTTMSDIAQKITDLWAREYGCPCFTTELNYNTPTHPYPHRWWEKIRDHWDQVVEPHKIDLKVQELKGLIRFLEVNTGKSFSYAKLAEVMNLVNEQEDLWAKARDLIAESSPCVVTLPDQLSMYPAQWHRGKPQGRDIIKAFYEETKERVKNGDVACPKEKIRMMWLGVGLWVNTAFFQYFEEQYGVTFVSSIYTSIAADGYARTIKNNDPLRALASRFAWLGVQETEWLVHIAKEHHCDGVVGFQCGPRPQLWTRYLEKNGIPVCEIPGNNVDARQWDDVKIRGLMKDFIEKRILPNKK
jgi:hypothetical protein